MSEPIRLDKRVAALFGCSRSEAQQYIEGGWVSVDGEVVELPQTPVGEAAVTLDPDARLAATEPATVLLHKPAGVPMHATAALVTPDTHSALDASGVRMLKRHFQRLTPLMPLEIQASGLVVLSQDGRVWRRLTEDAASIEEEFVVDVAGTPRADALVALAQGRVYGKPARPPCKASWQSENRLRFAIKAVQPGELARLCGAVGLQVMAIRRLRIGRVSLGKMAPGEWRYQPVSERF